MQYFAKLTYTIVDVSEREEVKLFSDRADLHTYIRNITDAASTLNVTVLYQYTEYNASEFGGGGNHVTASKNPGLRVLTKIDSKSTETAKDKSEPAPTLTKSDDNEQVPGFAGRGYEIGGSDFSY